MVRFLSDSSKNPDSSKSKGSAQRKSLGRKLTIEPLESRQMLAADLAEIMGVVRVDSQGDSDASNDTVVAGATATLYRDNGNGVFDNGDTKTGSAVSTDVHGKYRFNQVAAGQYFVKIGLPDGLQFQSGEDVKSVTISADEGDGIVGPTIDGFTTLQVVEASPPPVSSDAGTQLDSAVMGGERDFYVQLTESNNPISSISLAASEGNLYVASGPGATGNVKIVWDGVDGDANTVDATGLGGIDLTVSEGNTMTGIALTSGADHPNAVIKMRIYTDANNWSEFSTVVPESVGGAANGQAIFNFADTPTDSAGNGADFTNVGALELAFEGVTAVDAQVSLINLVGRANKQADFTASPRLSLGDKVWADINDDGILDANESAIAGVMLNLYQDSNNDNEYTPGTDQLLETQTTDANGMYLFTDLLPGQYIVQVDTSNFQTSGALVGLRSSLGGTTAPDPDNDTNNDDNGTPMAGAGVVSQAVLLVGDSEPTNDGDTDSNSNRSVDFGFFGFDLVLDKAVEQTAIAPTETLNYTIKINNDGPSEAANTTFRDELPGFVTYVSGTTDIPGVDLTHNNGVVTADFGTLAPGAVVYVTMVTTVNSNATGVLVNTATVSAPKEIDLSNNTDSVSNPITPRIDLAILKTVNKDEVRPGENFAYTLDIVNNGPSDATGVVITDTLPATGVVYVDSSVDPDSQSGDVLTYNIGDLASGATATVTIVVTAGADFEGTVVNNSHVEGNEEETTYANNDDDATVIIKNEPGSISGTVYVDRNDNGVFDSGEKTLSNVKIELKGTETGSGEFISRTLFTDENGYYIFEDLNPGDYRLLETQPNRYKDGKEHVGSSGGATGANPGPLLIPQNLSPEEIDDLMLGIGLGSGINAQDYDFGELAVTISKRSFLSR